MKIENESFKKENDKIRYFNLNFINGEKNNFNDSKENNFIEPYVQNILNMINNIQNYPNIELIKNNLIQIN